MIRNQWFKDSSLPSPKRESRPPFSSSPRPRAHDTRSRSASPEPEGIARRISSILHSFTFISNFLNALKLDIKPNKVFSDLWIYVKGCQQNFVTSNQITVEVRRHCERRVGQTDGERLCYATLLRRSLAWIAPALGGGPCPLTDGSSHAQVAKVDEQGGLVILGWIGNYKFR